MSLLIIFDCWNCVLMAVYLLNCQIAWLPGWTIHENYFQRNYSTLSAALNFKRKKPAAYVCVRYICLSSSAFGSYMLLSSEEALHLIRWKLCVHPQMRCRLATTSGCTTSLKYLKWYKVLLIISLRVPFKGIE